MKLNKAQLKAMAEGASQEVIASLASAPDPLSPEEEAAAAAAAAAATAAAVTPTEGIGLAAPAEPVVAAVVEPVVAAAAAPSELVNHLKAELATANTALLQAKVEAETFKAQAASVDGLTATLRAALGEKLVALGAPATAADGFTAASIVAEYGRVDAIFKKQFRVGGVAAVASPDSKDVQASIDPMFAEAMKHSLIK